MILIITKRELQAFILYILLLVSVVNMQQEYWIARGIG